MKLSWHTSVDSKRLAFKLVKAYKAQGWNARMEQIIGRSGWGEAKELDMYMVLVANPDKDTETFYAECEDIYNKVKNN